MWRAIVLACLLGQQAPQQVPPPVAPPRSTVITRPAEAPLGNLNVLYYDDTLLFAARAFAENRDGPGEPAPGLFVNAKEKNRWVQVTAVSTAGARLGRSWSDDPQTQRKLRTAPVAWDFTSFASRPYIDLPLRTTASIAFPDKVVFDATADQYELHFFSVYAAPTAETVLFIKRTDLLDAFARK